MRYTILLFIIATVIHSCKKPEDVLREFNITFAEAGDQVAKQLVALPNGVAIVGTSEVGGEKRLFLMTTDFNGKTFWKIELDAGTEGAAVIRTFQNNLVVVGTKVNQYNDRDILIFGTDQNGNILWQDSIGGPHDDIARDVIRSSNGGFHIIGTTQSFNADVAAMYVIRTNDLGSEISSSIFDGPALDGGSELTAIMNSSNIMLLGFTESSGAGNRDLYALRVTSDLNTIWSETYGGADYEDSQAIFATEDGNYLICGHSASEEPNHSLYALKLDQSGNILWEKHFGTDAGHEGGEAVLEDMLGNYVFVGSTEGFGNDEQVYFVKTNANGNILEELNFGASGNQRSNDVAEADDAYFIVGTSTVNNHSDVLLIKHPME